MLYTTERWGYYTKQTSSTTMRIYSGGQGWNPPFCVTCDLAFVTPLYVARYEKLYSDYSNRRYRWNPCQHYKVLAQTISPTMRIPWCTRNNTEIPLYREQPPSGIHAHCAWDHTTPVALFGPAGLHVSGLPLLYQTDTGDGFIPRPANLASMIDASLRATLPTIKAEMSLINSIIELKDFRSLPKTLRNINVLAEKITPLGKSFANPILNSINRRIRGTFSRNLGATLHELAHVGSDAYLAYEFAIKPALSDMCGIMSALSRTEKRVNDLVVRQGKRQLKHFTMHVPFLASNNVTSSQDTAAYALTTGQFSGQEIPPGTSGIYRKNFMSMKMTREVYPSVDAEFHAEIEYNYSFTRFQTENARMLGLLDALGINLNPSIIWNALPWSFVVDWFIGVGRWLDDRKTINMEPVINISRYLWSWKATRVVRTSIISTGGPIGHWPMPRTYLPDLVESAYRRDIDYPIMNSSVITSGLSSKELSLGVALAITRKRLPNKRALNPSKK